MISVLVSTGLLLSGAGPARRTRPFLIGVLSESWGPTPEVVGMRDGLLALGYREHEDFVIGVRFTQGDLAVLPAAARELVQQRVDLLFASNEPPVKAAQMATSQIPIVFAGQVDPVRAGRPVRWHILTHTILGTQMDAGPDLALVTDLKWRLARAGIATTLESRWVTFAIPAPQEP